MVKVLLQNNIISGDFGRRYSDIYGEGSRNNLMINEIIFEQFVMVVLG